MGNYNTRNIRFRQSACDFPLTVSLGNKAPAWGLSRWGGNSGLCFVPLDDERFTLRGDTRRLVYRGRRRSHRFTILSDGSFEYDIILNKEPESNIVVLPMEGAEQFDFFRQPDFIKDPFLAGSYAVYKKETLIGEGTGKLCHIHRPEIIDAQGRRCWGELSIAGNCLCITIPEQWLAEAKYPVVVDPTVGTTTVGSQITGTDPNNPSYDRPWLDGEFALNKLYVPQNGRGLCTAFVYAYNVDTESYISPCLYSNANNKPDMRKSKSEKEIYVAIFPGTYPAGWRSNTFNLEGDINAGNYVWFGLFGAWFTTRFDYGGECYKGWFDYDSYPEYDGEPTPSINVNDWATYCNIKWSWYFTYTAFTAQNYVRKITQGVKLSDTRKRIVVYKRDMKQSVKAGSGLKRLETFYRICVMTACAAFSIKRNPVFIRKLTEKVKASEGFKRLGTFYRNCLMSVNAFFTVKRFPAFLRKTIEQVKVNEGLQWVGTFYRHCVMTAHAAMSIKRHPLFLRKTTEQVKVNSDNSGMRSLVRICTEIITACFGIKHIQVFTRKISECVENADSLFYPVVKVRTVSDKTIVYEVTQHSAEYVKALEMKAGNSGETAHRAEYFRFNTETIKAEGVLFRGLTMLVRLVSGVFVRDYIFGRFLKAREELKLKSCITREIILDSKII